MPLDVPFEESSGARHHRKWAVNYRWEAGFFASFALVGAVVALNLWVGSSRLGAVAAILGTGCLLFAAHGSLKESRWHAARRKLHAAAADSEEDA